MTKVYLALGANVGEMDDSIQKAIELLKAQIQDLRRAPLYASKAVGYTAQPDFLNTAVVGNTDLEPLALLDFVKEIEQKVGRQKRFRWGPREIDIDIIFYGDQTIDTERLQVPHVRYRERDFVLRPIVDLDRDLTDPTDGKKVADLLAALPPSLLAVID